MNGCVMVWVARLLCRPRQPPNVRQGAVRSVEGNSFRLYFVLRSGAYRRACASCSITTPTLPASIVPGLYQLVLMLFERNNGWRACCSLATAITSRRHSRRLCRCHHLRYVVAGISPLILAVRRRHPPCYASPVVSFRRRSAARRMRS